MEYLPQNYIFYAGPFNFTLDSFNNSVHFGSDPWFDYIFYINDPSCTPDDGITQTIKETNFYLTTAKQQHEFYYVMSISLVVEQGALRPFLFIVENITVE